mgnify:CR=1 FL=1
MYNAGVDDVLKNNIINVMYLVHGDDNYVTLNDKIDDSEPDYDRQC